MSKYTIALHAERVQDMLDSTEEDRLITSCPATETFYILAAFIPEALENENETCSVCRTFVGIPEEKQHDVCPCDYYEHDEAIAITKRKLEEWKNQCVKVSGT